MTIEWVASRDADVTYPAAPWDMVGQLWLSIFKLRDQVDGADETNGASGVRPAGVYGAAFVSYEDGSPLTYSELLVARPGRRRHATASACRSPTSGSTPPPPSPAVVSCGRSPRACATSTSRPATAARCRRPSWSTSFGRQADRERDLHRRLEGDGRGCRSRARPGSPASTTPTARSAPPSSRAPRRRCPAARPLGLRRRRPARLDARRPAARVVPPGRLPDVLRLSLCRAGSNPPRTSYDAWVGPRRRRCPRPTRRTPGPASAGGSGAKTFAHVMVAQEGYESAYRDITGVAEPTTVLTFRATGDELLALVHAGPPFYQPPWSPTIVGMVLDDDTDWAEVAELVTESYRLLRSAEARTAAVGRPSRSRPRRRRHPGRRRRCRRRAPGRRRTPDRRRCRRRSRRRSRTARTDRRSWSRRPSPYRARWSGADERDPRGRPAHHDAPDHVPRGAAVLRRDPDDPDPDAGMAGSDHLAHPDLETRAPTAAGARRGSAAACGTVRWALTAWPLPPGCSCALRLRGRARQAPRRGGRPGPGHRCSQRT